MRKVIIVALMCLNAALLVVLIAGRTPQRAYGQVVSANYLAVTGNIKADYDALYVINLAQRRLVALRYETEGDPPRIIRITPRGGRDLRRDFKHSGR